MGTGASARLDAVLYDEPPKADLMLNGERLGDQADAIRTELRNALDQVLATR